MKRPGGFDSEVPAPPGLNAPVADVPESVPVPGSESSRSHRDERPAPGAGAVGAGSLFTSTDGAESPGDGVSHLAASAESRSLNGAVEKQRIGQGLRVSLKRSHGDPVKAAERRVREAERQTKRRRRRETRRFTAEARKTRRKWWIVAGTIVSLMLFVAAIVFTPLMAVKEVQVEGAETVNVADIEQALRQFDGVPLALVDENEVLRALEAFPLIQRFAVERVPPHTLLVRVEERTPVIAVEQDGAFLLYDAAGVLVSSVTERPAGVPLGIDTAQQTSTRAFMEAAQVIRDLPAELRSQVVSVSAKTGQDVTLTLDSGVEVFWGNPEKTKRKAVVLQAMLSSLSGRPVSHIDVSSSEAPVFR